MALKFPLARVSHIGTPRHKHKVLTLNRIIANCELAKQAGTVSQFPTVRLNPDLYHALHACKSVKVFDQGATLFCRGTPVTGVYVVDSGRVRILLPEEQGRPQLLEIDGPGTILGLSESMSGENYRVTVQAEDSVIVSYVSQEGLMQFLRENNDFCMQVVRLLSEDLHGLYHKFRNLNARPGRPRRRHPEEGMN